MRKVINYLIKLIILSSFLMGLFLVGYAGKDIYEIKVSEDKAMKEAVGLIEQSVEKRKSDKPFLKKDFSPDFGSSIGILQINKIDANLPIVEGTSEYDLKKGVGHYSGTAYPLEDNQIVLSGHRDTVFRRMGELELGDILTVRMPYGDFDYEIVNTKIVPADDLSIIVPHDEEILTVTTCYPFRYIGNAPDRYIIDAKPVYKKKDFADVLQGMDDTNASKEVTEIGTE